MSKDFSWWNIIFNRAPATEPQDKKAAQRDQNGKSLRVLLLSFIWIPCCLCFICTLCIVVVIIVLFFRDSGAVLAKYCMPDIKGCSPECKNGGTCLISTCQCKDRFEGDACQIGLPYNKGIWNETNNRAICLPRFTGQLCEIGHPFNGGIWNVTNQTANCPTHFTGILCEIGHPLNGGRWVEDLNKAMCKEGFTGQLCEIGKPYHRGEWRMSENRAICPEGFSGRLCRIAHICPEDFKKVNSICYRMIDDNTEWPKAYQNCRHLGGNLVSFKTQDEWNSFSQYFSLTKHFWTAGNDIRAEGEFVWKPSRTPLSWTSDVWCTGVPEISRLENCVEVSPSNGRMCLTVSDCILTLDYICEIRLV